MLCFYDQRCEIIYDDIKNSVSNENTYEILTDDG